MTVELSLRMRKLIRLSRGGDQGGEYTAQLSVRIEHDSLWHALAQRVDGTYTYSEILENPGYVDPLSNSEGEIIPDASMAKAERPLSKLKDNRRK